MERSEWDDDEYPSAPVPRHERQWRHPSEMGAAHWERTEPPLALGRGLLATTGIIGALLALGVLWVMLPTGPDDDTAIDVSLPADTTDLVLPDPRTTSSSTPTATSTTITRPVPSTTTDAPAAPVATVSLRRESAPAPAVAVVVASGSMVVTTARALDQDGQLVERLDIRLADGTTTSANVVMVDSRSGLAVLALPDGAASDAFTMAAVPGPGERLTILSDHPRTVVMPGAEPEAAQTAGLRMPSDAPTAPATTAAPTTTVGAPAGTTTTAVAPSTVTATSNPSSTTTTTSTTVQPTTTTPTTSTTTTTTVAPTTTTVASSSATIVFGRLEGIDPDEIAEGTPVVDADGHLVGVCSHADDGHSLLLVRLDALLGTAGNGTQGNRAPRGWMGIVVGSGATPLTITAIDAEGPAAAAGLAIGDRIVAIDGHSIATTADLAQAIAGTRPGDRVAVTIAGTLAGPPQQTVTITLGERSAQL